MCLRKLVASIILAVYIAMFTAAAHLLIALIPSNSFRQSFRSSRNLVSPHKETILVSVLSSFTVWW